MVLLRVSHLVNQKLEPKLGNDLASCWMGTMMGYWNLGRQKGSDLAYWK